VIKTNKKTNVEYVHQKGLVRKIKAGEEIITLSGDKIINISKYSTTLKIVKRENTLEVLELNKAQYGDKQDEEEKSSNK